MKLCSFIADERPRLGAFADGKLWDLNAAAQLDVSGRTVIAATMRELLAEGEHGLDRARAALALAHDEQEVALAAVAFDPETVEWLAPVPDPGKIFCIGLNYRDHCEEGGRPVPDKVTVFNKLPGAVSAHGRPIVLPGHSDQVDWEAELAVVIGRAGRDIPEAAAMAHVAGYCCFNDVSARDIQQGDGGGQWLRGKSCDTFAPFGPWLVTADEVPDPHALAIESELNGELMQSSNTEHLIFRVPYLLAELSKGITLQPGDVIATGTPGGVGLWRDPPRFLQPGDTITVRVAGLGALSNPVIQP